MPLLPDPMFPIGAALLTKGCTRRSHTRGLTHAAVTRYLAGTPYRKIYGPLYRKKGVPRVGDEGGRRRVVRLVMRCRQVGGMGVFEGKRRKDVDCIEYVILYVVMTGNGRVVVMVSR